MPDSPAPFVRGKILGWIGIPFKVVVMTNSTLSFTVVLLGATVCADTRDVVSSERHIASKRWGMVAEAMAALEGATADEVQVG